MRQSQNKNITFAALLLFAAVFTFVPFPANATGRLIPRTWTINNSRREALLHIPIDAKKSPTPVVFVFHGHGGTMQKAAMMFRMGQLWPHAIVVYMQGLNTPGKIVDPKGEKSGWQCSPGEQADRDLKFFDAVLSDLTKEYDVDRKRIYATGHSNGATFTYLLWATRREHFAAFAPSAGVPVFALTGNGAIDLGKLRVTNQPLKPILHVGADNDPLVKSVWQKNSIDALLVLYQCGPGKPWKKNHCTIHESKSGAPVLTCIHHAKHGLPEQIPALIAEFFKSQEAPSRNR